MCVNENKKYIHNGNINDVCVLWYSQQCSVIDPVEGLVIHISLIKQQN